MRILVVGGGGREHAIVHKLSQSPSRPELYCAPGNGGISRLATCAPIAATDLPGMLAYAKAQRIDLVVVAQDDPLALGMVDLMEENGIPAFGPTAAAAQIEASKVFSKHLMKRYGIPSAAYEVFDDPEAAKAYIRAQGAPIVVKADGLALGKGVIVAQSVEEAEAAVDDMMVRAAFGQAGSRVVVEEFMTGPEVSVLCFTDGKTILPMVSSQDHKRALDGDEGLNTGGMGAFAPSPLYTQELAQRVRQTILEPTIAAMAAEGRPFRGVLYVGLMLTPQGVRVLEYNARFGDPEAQVVLPLMENDLLDVMQAIREQRLQEVALRFRPECAVIVAMASGGYPKAYEKGKAISGIEDAEALGLTVYHAGTALTAGGLVTSGGRVLGVTAVASDMPTAIHKAYEGVSCIQFEGAHFRHDIGQKALSREDT